MATPAGLPSIQQKIRDFHACIEGDRTHRYRSWELCYGYFRRITPAGIAAQRDTAALQLGFYLASWGMYRGSGFLIKHAYIVHEPVIDCLATREYLPLWHTEFGCEKGDSRLIPMIESVIKAIRGAYKPFKATDTLITKVILGTFGCLPACDRYFVEGLKSAGLRYTRLDTRFIERIRRFCHENVAALRVEQRRIETRSGIHYPLMKLVNMYFWQIGSEKDKAAHTGAGPASRSPEAAMTALTTAGRGHPFSYSPLPDGGYAIVCGAGFRVKMSGDHLRQMLDVFKGQRVVLGTSRDNPPAGSLGKWLQAHVTRSAIATYVGPILVHERLATWGERSGKALVLKIAG